MQQPFDMRFPLFYVGTSPFSGDTEWVSLPGRPSRSLPSPQKSDFQDVQSIPALPAAQPHGADKIYRFPPSFGWIKKRTHGLFGRVLFCPTSTLFVFNTASISCPDRWSTAGRRGYTISKYTPIFHRKRRFMDKSLIQTFPLMRKSFEALRSGLSRLFYGPSGPCDSRSKQHRNRALNGIYGRDPCVDGEEIYF